MKQKIQIFHSEIVPTGRSVHKPNSALKKAAENLLLETMEQYLDDEFVEVKVDERYFRTGGIYNSYAYGVKLDRKVDAPWLFEITINRTTEAQRKPWHKELDDTLFAIAHKHRINFEMERTGPNTARITVEGPEYELGETEYMVQGMQQIGVSAMEAAEIAYQQQQTLWRSEWAGMVNNEKALWHKKREQDHKLIMHIAHTHGVSASDAAYAVHNTAMLGMKPMKDLENKKLLDVQESLLGLAGKIGELLK